MCENALLPSPNWFLTSVASCSANGILAYGSRNGIVLVLSVEAKYGTAPEPKFTMVSNAHHEKVTTLAFCNRTVPTGHVLPNYALASGSEDGVVSIWNVETAENIMHQREHREKVTCIDWTRVGDFLLISVDERGKFVIWDVLANSARPQQLLNASRLSPITIACSPTNQDLVAAGCKDGHVCLLSIKGSGQLLTKLRGHDKAVVSMSWSPQEGEPESSFLASGGLDRKIHIWKTSNGQCVKVIHMPAKQLSKGFKARADNSKGNIQPWLPVYWLKPTLLLSASTSSELLAWNPLEDKPTPSLVHSQHLRGLACIAAHPYKSDQKNWRAPEKPCIVWTMAQDRMVIRTEFLSTTPETTNTEQESVEQAVEAEKQFPDEEALPVELVAKPESNGLADEVAKEAKELVNGTVPKQTVLDEPPALGCDAALEVEVVEKFETAKEAEETATTEPDVKLEEEESSQAAASVAVEQFEKAKEADEIQDDKTTTSELEETASEISDTTSVNEESTTEKDEVVKDVKPSKPMPKKKAVVKKAKELLTRSTILHTLGGFVYFLAPCPFTPGRVAIAVGDETIRVWNMNDHHTSNVVCIWQRIKGKVMTLSWHPEKEGVLGFATNEGRVGICNVSNLGKEPLVFRQFHRSTVYRVAWGPPTYIKTAEPPARSDLCLYASDESVSVYYDPSQPEEGPKLLKVIIKSTNPNMKVDVKHKELAWKSDFSLLAIGLEDGCVQLFSAPHLQCVHTLLAHKKSVFFLAWHPQCTATDTDGAKSAQCHWLATSSVDQQIKVFDLTPLAPDDETGSWKHVGLPIESLAELKHGNKVVSLCWNPHISGQLAASSYDKTVKVWDVARKQLLACYNGHSSCVLSCCWSLVDPDVMLSGSGDFTVQVWRISKSQPQEEILSSENQSRVTSDVQQRAEPLSPAVVRTKQETTKNGEPQSGAGKSAAQKKGKKSNKITKLHMFPVSGSASHHKENAIVCCEMMLQAKGVLPAVQLPEPAIEAMPEQAAGDASESSPPCIDSATNDTASVQTKIDEALLVVKNTPNIGYFTTQENFQAMLDLDGKALATSGNFNGLHNLELWRGNLHETLKTAAQTKHLNDWLVSIAPTVSHKVWLEMCTAYAKQLAEEEDFMKAASYLLVCHKVLDAVELLKSHSCYREAVVLCRCRLGPDDPTTKNTMLEWAKSAAHLGSLELAIQCYIACGEYDKAVHLLSRRNNVKMWQLGAVLAENTGNSVMCSSLISECLSACLQEEKWAEATTLITQHPELTQLQLLVETHKIVSELGKEESPSKEQLALIWSASTSAETKTSEGLLHSISKICSDQEEGLYEKLMTLLPPKTSLPDNRKELLMQTSRLLLLAAVARKEKNDDWERFVVNALHISHRRNLVCVKERPLHYLLWWLRAPVLEKMSKSERAFICDAMLDCLSRDNPEAPKLLLSNKEFLLDTDSALYSRLSIVAKNLEKEVAAAQAAGNESAERVRKSLAETRDSLKELENDRVAFPNTLVMVCKLQNYIDYFRQKDMLSREELELWYEDLAAFHKNLH